MSPVRSGKLRHYVTLEQPSNVQSVDGSMNKVWSPVGNLYIGFQQTGGGQFSQGKQEHERGVYTTRPIHYDSRVKADMRIRLGERVFNIESVNDFDGRGGEMTLTLVEER